MPVSVTVKRVSITLTLSKDLPPDLYTNKSRETLIKETLAELEKKLKFPGLHWDLNYKTRSKIREFKGVAVLK